MDLLVKAITILVLGLLAVSACASIGRAGEGLRPAMDANRLIVEAADWDWQGPQSLPPRFRNHCSYDSFSGRPYCSDHCGIDYQFYHCLNGSLGIDQTVRRFLIPSARRPGDSRCQVPAAPLKTS
jgi:hypothetical protein